MTGTARSRLGTRGALMITLSCIIMTFSATMAHAVYTDNIVPTVRFGGCNEGTAVQSNTGGPCLTDNASVGYWMESPIDRTTGNDSTAEQQINVTMADYNRNTDLTTFYDSTPTFSGVGETDVIYRNKVQDFRDSNTVGYYWCDSTSGRRCDQRYINLRYITNTPAQMRALACHESGHAFGLLHPDDSSPAKSKTDTKFECMMNAPVAGYYGIGWEPNVANINSPY